MVSLGKPLREGKAAQAYPARGAFGKVIRQKAGIAGRTARGRLPAWPRLEKAHPVRGDVSIPEKASVKRDRAYPARRDVSAWIPAVRRWAAEHSARGGVAQDLRRRMADAGKVPPYQEKAQCRKGSILHGGILCAGEPEGSSRVSGTREPAPSGEAVLFMERILRRGGLLEYPEKFPWASSVRGRLHSACAAGPAKMPAAEGQRRGRRVPARSARKSSA